MASVISRLEPAALPTGDYGGSGVPGVSEGGRDRKKGTMSGYLPHVFDQFEAEYPEAMTAFRELADRLHTAGPLSQRELRLAKLGIAIGRESEGGVRSHARKALAESMEPEAVRQVALLAITTAQLSVLEHPTTARIIPLLVPRPRPARGHRAGSRRRTSRRALHR